MSFRKINDGVFVNLDDVSAIIEEGGRTNICLKSREIISINSPINDITSALGLTFPIDKVKCNIPMNGI